MNVVRMLRRRRREAEIEANTRKRLDKRGTYGRRKACETIRVPGWTGWWSYHYTKGWRRDTPPDLKGKRGNRTYASRHSGRSK